LRYVVGNGLNEGYLYDADGAHVKQWSGSNATYYVSPLFEANVNGSVTTLTKYY
jgi:hypothetical protein